jgi:hypothetical protein
MRRRKTVRGNVITDEIVQINMKITEKPKQAKESQKPKEKKEEKASASKEAEKQIETEVQPQSSA